MGAKDPAFPDWLIAFDPSICLPPAHLIGRLRFDRPIGLHPASGAASSGSLLAALLDLLPPASALVRHWWSPFDSSIQQLIVCPRFSSVASLASHWSSRGLFVDHRSWRVFNGHVWIVLLSGEECINFAISELEGGGAKGRLFQTSIRCLDGAAPCVTSHVNSTARGQRSGGSQWGGEHSCCLGICVLLTGFQVLKSNATCGLKRFHVSCP